MNEKLVIELKKIICLIDSKGMAANNCHAGSLICARFYECENKAKDIVVRLGVSEGKIKKALETSNLDMVFFTQETRRDIASALSQSDIIEIR